MDKFIKKLWNDHLRHIFWFFMPSFLVFGPTADNEHKYYYVLWFAKCWGSFKIKKKFDQEAYDRKLNKIRGIN